jgi:hypothetical protein
MEPGYVNAQSKFQQTDIELFNDTSNTHLTSSYDSIAVISLEAVLASGAPMICTVFSCWGTIVPAAEKQDQLR